MNVLEFYQHALEQRNFKPDAAQRRAVERLQKCYDEWVDYKAQRSLLADVDAGKITKEELFANAEKLLKDRMPQPAAHKPAAPVAAAARPAAVVPAEQTPAPTPTVPIAPTQATT